SGRAGQEMYAPPLMAWVVPVMYPASSLESHTTSAAISSAVAWRPIGIDADSAASASAVVLPRMLVSAAPGETALTVMPSGAISRASERVRPSTPAFAAEYGVLENTPPPCCAETEDMFTMRPYPPSSIAGRNARQVQKVPARFTAVILSHRSLPTSRNGT